MTSSTLTGDRRWTSARRGGMTVLGKVAVPKPINLPSQRLENHGLDPNVEIVPKGTLSWGSRPSSAGSNAWGTSALSPSTDGGSSSPRHLVGRPSSSGGTRPSTAGSEKAHDSNVSAWGTNSRPSSASGVLASSHTSLTSLRPCSAETRPGSSQLSRFAEPPPEVSGVWGATSAPGRTGVASSAEEGFSLSTGDFPMLGSEKDESKTNMDSLDHLTHGQPDSTGDVRTMADSRGITHSDDLLRTSDIRGNSWRKDGPPFVENGPRPSMERWHGEPRIYPNPNMAPHYESWRGPPPVNSPGGVWFRGPPGPPYGGPVPPGGFPMEPFPYYHPQVPPGLAGSQPVPPGTGHHGLHPKNGDMPRMPHVPHMHPGMPMRPGFYPGPVPYDGYYRPPLGFCNPSDRDLPFMGMPPGAPVYVGHAHHNVPDINSHPRSREGRGPKHLDPGHPHDHCGPYKVLKNANDGWNQMNPNDGWNQNEEERGHRMKTSAVNREKGILSKAPLQENAWGDDYKKDEDIRYGRTANMESSHSSKNKLASVNPCSMKYSEQVSNIDEAPTGSAMDNVPYPQDHSLIQKIEGLNAKARAAGGKQEGFHMEEPNDRVHISGDKDDQFANEAKSDVILERHYPTGVLVPVPRNNDTPAVDRSHEPTAAPRRHGRGIQNSSNSHDPHAKGKFQEQEVDAWGKKIDSQPVMDFGWTSTTSDQVDHNDSNISNVDPSDRQRAKMREIAKQRAIQLQKEEEERVREQKAKALAKLEELNRRSANQSLESSGQKETITPLGDGPEKRESSRNKLETSVVASHNTGSSSVKNTAQNNGRTTSEIVDSGVSSGHVDAKTQINTHQEGVKFLQNQLPDDSNVDEPNVSQVREVSRQKRGAYRQRQNDPLEEHGRDKMPFGRADVLKDVKVTNLTEDVGGDVDSRAGREKAESSDIPELPVQRRKVNKSGKSRHKVEESSSFVTSMPKDFVAEATPETAGQNGSTMHVNSITDPKDVILSSEILASQYRDDSHGKANNSPKSQHFWKPRNTQDNRSSDKTHNNDGVFWAPVRSHNKFSATDHMSQKGAEPLPSSAAGNNFMPNSSKTKRAEMERYVPKPVAKEMTQQGSTLQSSSSDPPATDGSGGREKASQGAENVLKAGANMELKHVEGKNRHQRGQGSWRQRVSAETTGVHSSQDNAAANTRKNMQTFNVSQLDTIADESSVRGTPSEPDGHLEKEPQTIIDGWGFVVNDPSSATSTTFAAVKDHAPPGKGKRHPSKGQKGVGSHHHHEYKDSNAGLSDLPSSHFEAIHSEVSSVKESRVGGDHSASHWQRKSKGHVAHYQQGDAGPNSGGQNVASDPIKVSEDKGADQGKPGWGHHEVKREKKVAPVKGRPHLEPEALASDVEAITIGAIDERNERRPSSGHRKNVHYNGHNKRGHEPRGDWSSMARENKQHFSSTNRERHKQNSHYEYRPVGPYNGNSRSNEAVVQTENQSGALKYRERGQGHSRHGWESSFGRQSGNE